MGQTVSGELAIQVAKEMNKLAKYTETKVAAIYGRQNMRNQKTILMPELIIRESCAKLKQ